MIVDSLILKLKSLPSTTKFVAGSGSVLLGIISGLKPLFLSLLVLLIVDLATGLYAAKKAKEAITSTGLRRTIEKAMCYFTIIIVSVLADVYMFDVFRVSGVITAFIGMIELLSIFENFTKITGINFVGELKRLIKSKLSKVK